MHERRALIADHQELFGLALRSLLLLNAGFEEVRLVGTYQQAFDALSKDSSIGLLCLDLNMPGMNGFEGVRALKAVAPPDLFVVVVTTTNRRDDIVEAIKSGVHGYVSKSMHTREIVGAILKVLQGQIFIPPTILQMSMPNEWGLRTSALGERQRVGNDIGGNGPTRRWVDLTERQKEVGELIVMGKSNKEIANALDLAEGTVKVHVAALFRLLNVHNRAAAVTAIFNLRGKYD